MALKQGFCLGPYEIVSPLGAGGMGEVYKAKDTRLDRMVAIKVLPEDLAKNPDSLARFEREAKAVAALNHPNITGIHDIGHMEDTAYAVMELLEGESLRDRLLQGPLAPRKATELAIQMAQGLAAAHEKGVVHRDLKPDNLWITKDDRLKILDFGLAKQMTGILSGSEEPTRAFSPGNRTEEGMILGTLGYMSPEQVRGEKVDARSDIFSFGVVLFEMLTGKRAFARGSAADTMAAILKEEPPEIDDSGKAIPLGLRRILDHCLEKASARRFHDALDLAFALESASGSGSSASSTRSGILPMEWYRREARPGVLVALCACLLAALGALGWVVQREHRRPPEYAYKRLTFRNGNLWSARFAPDGNTILYSATWAGQPRDIYQVRLDSLESRPLGLPPGAELFSVSSKGELAIGLKKETGTTLARVPLMGGTPREILEGVSSADWSPDGGQLAVIHSVHGHSRVEFPPGTVRYDTEMDIRSLKVSPDGERLAVIEKNTGGDRILVLDKDGTKRTLSLGAGALYELAWSPRGDRLLTSWGPTFKEGDLWEISLGGGRTRLSRGMGGSYFNDAAHGGRLLVERSTDRQEAFLLQGREAEAQDISWLEGSVVSGLSSDGETVVFTDQGEGSGPRGGVWLRKPGRREPIRLCEGDAAGNLSPDGKWVPVRSRETPPRLSLVPTGPGQTLVIDTQGITVYGVWWPPNAGHLLAGALDQRTNKWGLYMIEISGGTARLVMNLEGDFPYITVRPDGSGLILQTPDGALLQARTNGHDLEPMSARTKPGDRLVGCSQDGRRLFLANTDRAPYRVDSLDLETGKRVLLRQLPGSGPDVLGYSGFLITPDGNSIAYSIKRVLTSDLYLAEEQK